MPDNNRVRILERNLGGFGNWGTDGEFSNPQASSWNLGQAVAVSGTTFAAGAPKYRAGLVLVYQQQVTADDDGFVDADPVNDTPSGAQPIMPRSEQADLGFGMLTAGDIDYYAIDLDAGDFFAAESLRQR